MAPKQDMTPDSAANGSKNGRSGSPAPAAKGGKAKNGSVPASTAAASETKSGGRGYMPCFAVVIAVAVLLKVFISKFDLLNGLDSNKEHSQTMISVYGTAFCLSPVPGMLLNEAVAGLQDHNNTNMTFEDTGNIEDDDYAQESIYAILYGMYKTTKLTSQHGVEYFFTFNTWGFNDKTISEKAASTPFLGNLRDSRKGPEALAHFDFQERFPEQDPERYGKMAYASLPTMNAALEYMSARNVGLGDGTQRSRVNAGFSDKPRPVEIVEIGCGTGAGANLISRQVVQNSNYLALDMQKAAVNTCQQRHEGRGPVFASKLAELEAAVDSSDGTHPSIALLGSKELRQLEEAYPKDNPSLQCRLVPNGVGHLNNATATETNSVPRETNSVDFVIISETHIADMRIGDLEKAIFTEIKRILKPGGLFLWGNAIPTRVWREAEVALPQMGFELVENNDWTAAAVVARDLDAPRVDLCISQLLAPYNLFKIPYFGPRCHNVVERLIANFYRHPGTALYLHMTTKFDSYLQQAWRLKE